MTGRIDRDAARDVCFNHMVAPTAEFLDALEGCVRPASTPVRLADGRTLTLYGMYHVIHVIEAEQGAWLFDVRHGASPWLSAEDAGKIAELFRPAPRQTIDRDALVDLFIRYDVEHPATLGDAADVRSIYVDRILALLRPPDGVTLTPVEAHLVADFVREHVDTGWADPEWPTDGYLRALADRLEAAGGR